MNTKIFDQILAKKPRSTRKKTEEAGESDRPLTRKEKANIDEAIRRGREEGMQAALTGPRFDPTPYRNCVITIPEKWGRYGAGDIQNMVRTASHEGRGATAYEYDNGAGHLRERRNNPLGTVATSILLRFGRGMTDATKSILTQARWKWSPLEGAWIRPNSPATRQWLVAMASKLGIHNIRPIR